MPIYAYRCESCGHAKDVLQKMSDAQLTVCPSCGAATFTKQLTAAGFQLKGTGWYATDFKGGKTAAPAPAADTGSSEVGGGAADTGGAAAAAENPTSKTESKTESSTPSTGTSCGGSCACH